MYSRCFRLFHALLLLAVASSFDLCIKSCFKECEDPEKNFCTTEDCVGAFGNNDEASNMAFIGVRCSNPNDNCYYREIIVLSTSGRTPITLPGGCLLEHQSPTRNTGIFRFQLGEELFACDGNFCNLAPLERCSFFQASLRGVNPDDDPEDLCAIREEEDFEESLIQNVVREDRGFCISDDLVPVEIDSDCVFDVDISCESSDIVETDIATCAECESDPLCDPSEPLSERATKQPSNTPTNLPTERPSLNPTSNPAVLTNSPTRKPTETPTEAPSKATTEMPTFNPSKNPSAVPTLQPTTEFPTGVPVNSPSMAPTETPTEAPSKATTEIPTFNSIRNPTAAPTLHPTKSPVILTSKPSLSPSAVPTDDDTSSSVPTLRPTTTPTNAISPSPENIPVTGTGLHVNKTFIIAAVIIMAILVVLIVLVAKFRGSRFSLLRISSSAARAKGRRSKPRSSSAFEEAGYLSGNQVSLPSIFGNSGPPPKRSTDGTDSTVSVESGLF